MSDQAMQVPLVELLARVPAGARLVYEHSSIDHSFIPVGRYCNEAAAALRAKDEHELELMEENVHLESCNKILHRDWQTEKRRAEAAEARVRELEAYIASMTGQGS